MNHPFHELTRSLARSVTGRGALKKFGLCLAGMALSGSCLLSAHATLIVVPEAQTLADGNTWNGAPIGFGFVRYQQVYAASQFSTLGGPALITQLAFRPDGLAGHAFSSTWNGLRVDLSTTTKAPDGLSTTFADNIGANDTIVFGGVSGGTWAHASSFTGPAGGPKDFDIILTFDTPFLYNPTAGNLLLDIRHNDYAYGYSDCDAQYVVGDSVSRVFRYGIGTETATTGGADSLGLVTQFTFAAVPEPPNRLVATLLLLPLGVSTIRRWVRRSSVEGSDL